MADIQKDKWIRPWNIEKFDDLYNRDDRFFSILMKGTLCWLTDNIMMYNKHVRHFIFNTGSYWLYVESNGYSFSMNETSGEDAIYMELPRCIVEMGNVSIPFEELTSPFSRGNYERRSNDEIKGYNAQLRRIPVEWNLNLNYVLSNFNESMILLQEIIDKLAFQQYFNITYLGQVIECSIEIPNDFNIEINKIDMTSPDVTQKTIKLSVKICSSYPLIDERSEISASSFISQFNPGIYLFREKIENETDTELSYTVPTKNNKLNLRYYNPKEKK